MKKLLLLFILTSSLFSRSAIYINCYPPVEPLCLGTTLTLSPEILKECYHDLVEYEREIADFINCSNHNINEARATFNEAVRFYKCNLENNHICF